MAIKRTSRSVGAPVRKSGSSPGLFHVNVLPAQRLVAGESHSGWMCKGKSCGRLIAIAPPPVDGKAPAAIADDQLAAIKCPHCGEEDLYRWGARGEHVYAGG